MSLKLTKKHSNDMVNFICYIFYEMTVKLFESVFNARLNIEHIVENIWCNVLNDIKNMMFSALYFLIIGKSEISADGGLL